MYRYEKKEGVSYSLGTTLTIEALLYKPSSLRRIYISEKQHRDETYDKIVSLARRHNIKIIQNNAKIFHDLSNKENVMVIGEFEKFVRDLPNGNHLVLINPMNQGNLGTIIRSGLALGIDGLAIISPAADIFDPKVVRGSMGAIFRLPFRYYASFEEYMESFPSNHFYPFMLQAKKKLNDVTPKVPYSLIYGNEATGLPSSFLSTGEPLIIEQSPSVDSLNLDNAVSIGLYVFKAKAK